MEVLINKLEQICQCGVCLERLHEPKQLLCQHIFCQRCLMKTCTENRMGLMSLFCPACRERQPMIYRPFDVIQLKSPLFVNQVLEVLIEYTKRKDTDNVASGCISTQKLLNTKITSVYKTINMDTLEHMTQIRTDEFGIRDSKVQELEKEVQKSKEINSQLLIDNFIMKAKLNEKEKRDYSLDDSETTFKQTSYKELVNKTDLKDNNKLSSKVVHAESMGKIYGDKKYEVDKTKCNDKTDNGDKHHYIEEKLNNYLRKKATKHLSTSNTEKGTKTEQSVTNNKEFCWRCLRQGHTGVQCKESKTVLGRNICSKCNKVGHVESTCTVAE